LKGQTHAHAAALDNEENSEIVGAELIDIGSSK
jgi:hypothetical protein